MTPKEAVVAISEIAILWAGVRPILAPGCRNAKDLRIGEAKLLVGGAMVGAEGKVS